jgi:Flp pilus assembly protein TadG
MMTVHKRAVRAAARLASRFRDDTSGNVAVIFALVGVVLMLAIGAAVDVGRWLHARDQTVAAVDAAVLAGGRVLQTNSANESAAIAAAQKYYDENVTSRLPVIDDSVNFAVAPDGMGMTASGTAYIKTPFLQFAAIDKLPLISTSQTDFGKSQIAVGGNGGENIEVALMLDITGSMCNNAPGQTQAPCTSGRKIDAMKDAAKDLVNIIVWQDQSKFTSKVSIVPFSDSVRLPTSAITKALGSPAMSITKTTGSGSNKKTYYYNRTQYCVVERAGTNRYTDVAPGANNYAMPIRWEVEASKKSNYANCTLDASSEVLPLTNVKQTLIDKIDALGGKGGTAGQVGTAWAWYTLSPNWKSLWAASAQPVAYLTPSTRKIAILMTDGEYNTEYTSEGIKTGSPGASTTPANGTSAVQAKALCAAMKEKTKIGIEVYTVGFEVGSNASAADVLSSCASEPGKYYDAKDEEELKQAFRDIALKLSSLYLSK